MANDAFAHRAAERNERPRAGRGCLRGGRIIRPWTTSQTSPWREQMEHYRRFGSWLPEKRPCSAWELERVVYPRSLKELDELAAA